MVVVGRRRRMRLAVGATARAASASFVPVLPTEPVTPMNFPLLRSRAARASAVKRFQHVAHHQQRRVLRKRSRACRAATTARPAPAFSAASTKSWPSRTSLRARRTPRPAKRCAVSMDNPETPAGKLRRAAPRPSRRPSRPPSKAAVSPSRSRLRLLQRRRDRLVIAERQHPVADDLAGFMALAGDQQNIARCQTRQWRCEWLRARSPISIAPGAASRMAARIAAGILAARIVVGDDHPVGHSRAAIAPIIGRLPVIAVAAGAEHDDEPAASHKAAAPRAPWPRRRACARSR